MSTVDNKAIVYLRVSTKAQKDKGFSLENQKNKSIEYAEKHNLEIKNIYEEVKSASKVNSLSDIENNLLKSIENRPKLHKILDLASRKKFNHLIVYSRDRLSRNVDISTKLQFYLKSKNITLHFSKEGENIDCSSEPLSKFLETIFSSIAELEANLIGSRTSDGKESCIKSGYWCGGQTPFGYITEKESRKSPVSNKAKKSSILKPAIIESEYVKEIFNLYVNHGYSYRKIADILNKNNDCSYWKKSTIESILRNEVYAGYLVWNKTSKNPNKVAVRSDYIDDIALINSSIWKSTLNLRKNKLNSKDKKYYSTPFLLRGKLKCNICKRNMVSKNYGKDRNGNQRRNIYKCCTKVNNKSELVLYQEVLEKEFLNEFIKVFNPENINDLWQNYCEKVDPMTSKIKDSIDEVDTLLEDKQNRLESCNTFLNQNEDVTLKNLAMTEIVNLRKEIDILEKSKDYIETIDSKLFKSQIELSNALDNFFKYDFNELEQGRRRMLIDNLIDDVLVWKDNQDNIKFHINLNSQISF